MIDLTGKHLLVGGGSRGIGRTTALLAARVGAAVSVNYVQNQAAAQAVVAEIVSGGGKAVAVQADLAAEGEATRAVREAVEALGPITSVAIAAGIFEPSPIAEMTTAFWDRTMALNLRSTFLAVQAAVPVLRQAKAGGSIVIYTSTAGQRGSSVYSAYATSKGAQILFMRSMAKELAPARIRVNCVAPGWTETDMSREAMDAEGREGIIASIPLGRIGRPADPANAALFLISDLAEFITGSTITVDGGYDMRG
ncbi:MAG: SDR family oxidoreductase [Cytophagales bacterium]|nr:SDR family oxidoreductase [Armatimonadota bacterium]